MKKRIIATILVFTLALVIFNAYTTKVIFTDVTQYLNVAKEFAGEATSKVRNTPGWGYGLILGQALSFSPSLFTAKIFNALWLVFDAILLFLISKRWRTLLIFTFSPIVWYMGSWISPLMPVSFLFLYAYYNIQKYNKTNKKRYVALAGLAMGLASTLWWAAVYITVFFVISYFLLKKLIDVAWFVIFWGLTFGLRILLDMKLFGLPFYSTLRGLGSNVMYGIGKVGTESALTSKLVQLALLAVIISPFMFRFYRVNPITNFKDFAFLGLTSLLLIANLQLRYFIILAPIFILLLAPTLTKKEIKLHLLISLVLIVFLTMPYFGATDDQIISQDLKNLAEDYPHEIFVAGAEDTPDGYASLFSSLYWGDKIKEFVEYDEYRLGVNNEKSFRNYKMTSNSKINNLRKLQVEVSYLRTDNRNFKDVELLVLVGETEPKGFKLEKEYEILRVFRKN